jgi:hypothetical protein
MTGLPPFKFEVVLNPMESKPGLFTRLRKLSYNNGHMREYFHQPSTIAILAIGSRGGIYGWSMLYDYHFGFSSHKTISVFVKSGFRHFGLGSMLKDAAAKECAKYSDSYCWQNKHTRTWHETVLRYPC